MTKRRWRLRPWWALGLVAMLAGLSACALLARPPREASLEDRLGAFPTAELPLTHPVVISWNDHQIPFVEAQSDDDLAFVLGLVHAHLRLGQMEALRRISQGRIAEMAGPIAADIDHALRIVDFGKAVPEVAAALPPETRRWLDHFVRGINHHLTHVRPLPHEFTLLGLEVEPWTVADVLTIGRLASTDVNWLVWFRLLQMRERADWDTLWTRLIDHGSASLPSYAALDGDDLAALDAIIAGLSRSGSNSLAVSAAHSASGSALIASDPHLGISIPNVWLLAGYKSPSYHVVGLMIPGLPFVALGRNPWIAWGGTNMRAASSDLFDVASLPPEAIRTRTERIGVRWWFDREVEVRDTDLGPVITDAPQLAEAKGPVALRWVGHRTSDEMSAMLGVNRARNFAEFRAALSTFAISAQNMIYADAEGHIGQSLAVHIPARAPGPPADLVLEPARADHWRRILTGSDLPYSFDPPAGFIASANNRASDAAVPLGYFFSSNDRIERLSALLGDGKKVDIAMLEALQEDVHMASSAALRDALIARLDELGLAAQITGEDARILDRLRAWNGDYAVDSEGALAFELTVHAFVGVFYDDADFAAYSAAGRVFELMREDVAAAPGARIAPALKSALAAAAARFGRFGTWGEMHRLEIAHQLANVPLIGSRYRFGDYPAAGSSATLMKTAHAITDERHGTRYGSNARHVSDLGDVDGNYFVLLGGQDGWFGSANFLDQVPLWRSKDYIRLPLRLQTVHAEFRHRMTLAP